MFYSVYNISSGNIVFSLKICAKAWVGVCYEKQKELDGNADNGADIWNGACWV